MHDVIGVLEHGTPWFEKGNILLIMLTINLPLSPFCREVRSVGRTVGEEREDMIMGGGNVVEIQGMGGWREDMKVDAFWQGWRCARLSKLYSAARRASDPEFLFPLTFFWREAVVPSVQYHVLTWAVFLSLKDFFWP